LHVSNDQGLERLCACFFSGRCVRGANPESPWRMECRRCA
jgi:hypothetical protein